MRRARGVPGARYRFIHRPAAISDTRRCGRWGSVRLLFIWLRAVVARDKRAVGYAASAEPGARPLAAGARRLATRHRGHHP